VKSAGREESLLDGNGVAGLGAEVVEELGGTLLSAGIVTEGIDDPDLAEVHCCCEGGALGVSWDELDVLNSTTIWDFNRADDSSGWQVPEAESVGMLDSQAGLQDGDRNDEVRCQDDVLLPVDTETVGRELLAENVECASDILGPFVDDVVVGICFYEASRGCSYGRAHVGNEETTIWLCANLIRDRSKNSTVTLLERWSVRV
jgi:hypothetical protein